MTLYFKHGLYKIKDKALLKFRQTKLFSSAIYQLCQSMPGTAQGQAGTSRDRQGQAGTRQGQTGTFPFCPCLSILIPVCPCLSLLVLVFPCMSLSVLVCRQRLGALLYLLVFFVSFFFLVFALFLKVVFWTYHFYWANLRPHFQNSFP